MTTAGPGVHEKLSIVNENLMWLQYLISDVIKNRDMTIMEKLDKIQTIYSDDKRRRVSSEIHDIINVVKTLKVNMDKLNTLSNIKESQLQEYPHHSIREPHKIRFN